MIGRYEGLFKVNVVSDVASRQEEVQSGNK